MPRTPPPDLEVVRRATQTAVLHALATASDVEVIVAAANPADKRVDLLAGAAVLELAAFALELAVPTGGEPLHYDGLRQRYLPEIVFAGRVVSAAARA